MSSPDWKSSTAGTKVRVALWLQAEIGEGGRFTKADLRAAFPNVEQVDRRMRDLRAEGWVLATAREDPALKPDELRLVKIGGRVWEAGYRSRAAAALTSKQRRVILARDGFACTVCGVVGGAAYPDDPIRTATLGILGRGESAITACDRCRSGGIEPEDPMAVAKAIGELAHDERESLSRWIRAGSRRQTGAERLWVRYRRLPQDAREKIRKDLEAS